MAPLDRNRAFLGPFASRQSPSSSKPFITWTFQKFCMRRWKLSQLYPQRSWVPSPPLTLPLRGHWRGRLPSGAGQASGAGWGRGPHTAGNSTPGAYGAEREPGGIERKNMLRAELENKCLESSLCKPRSTTPEDSFHSPAFCPQSCARLPGPEKRDHRWCAVLGSESAGKSLPRGHGEYPPHYQPLAKKPKGGVNREQKGHI